MDPVQANEAPLLRAANISKRFGITRALDNVSVSFRAGEVHALMGENGAGKSTLGKVIAGLHRQDSGTVMIREAGGERALQPGSLRDAYAAGVRIVHQELAQCPNLTVAENLSLHDVPRNRIGFVDGRAMRQRAERLLAGLEPSINPRTVLGGLSPGHRQIVQIAGALDARGEERVRRGPASSAGGSRGEARMIVLDEPTSSLSVAEVERLLKIVRDLAAQGLAVVYVSHRMGEIFAVCDRVTVLRDGHWIGTSPVREIDEGALVQQMIGRRLELVTRAEGRGPAEKSGAPLLAASDVSSPGRLRSVSLSARAGEVVGIGGLVGSGRSEFLSAVFGLDPRSTGTVIVGGQRLSAHNPRATIAAGIGYVPEDRKLQGLFFQLNIGDNIAMPIIDRLARLGVRSARRERAHVTACMERFEVKAASRRSLPGELSGGNQQKLLIARWMSTGAKVLLLDEPTRGIDVGTKAEVHRLVREAAAKGAAVVLVSSEMPELLALSDRIAVLCEGRLTGELSGDEMTQANILRLATTRE